MGGHRLVARSIDLFYSFSPFQEASMQAKARLLHRGIHIQLLTISSPSPNRIIRPHLHARSHPPRPTPPIREHLRTTPSPPKRNLISKQLPKPKHKPNHKRQEQINRRTPKQPPYRRR